MSPLVAHAGGTGWDEIVVFALPVVILLGLQFYGRRRKAQGDENGSESESDDTGGDTER
jgi:hypothetical protein